LLLFSPFVRYLRRQAGRIIRQEAITLQIEPTEWHSYEMTWKTDCIEFVVNGEEVFTTTVVPQGSLGLVIWVDNQYASISSSDRLGYGFLPNPEPAWIEIGDLRVAPI
jgi:hypothetical protein